MLKILFVLHCVVVVYLTWPNEVHLVEDVSEAQYGVGVR